MELGQITSIEFFGNEKFVIGKIMQGGMGIVYQLVGVHASTLVRRRRMPREMTSSGRSVGLRARMIGKARAV
jgi:hypothetical protein